MSREIKFRAWSNIVNKRRKMKRRINSIYLQCKEAYLDGFKEGFSRACHLNHKCEYHDGYEDGFSDAFRIALDIDKAFAKDGGEE